jgi:hypothetical protein
MSACRQTDGARRGQHVDAGRHGHDRRAPGDDAAVAGAPDARGEQVQE